MAATSASSGGSRSRRMALPPMLLLAAVTVFVMVLVFSESQIQAGYLRYIATPRQYVSRVSRVFPRSSVSCPQPAHPSTYHFSTDPRPPPALVSYPGSGSTLTRLLLEITTQGSEECYSQLPKLYLRRFDWGQAFGAGPDRGLGRMERCQLGS